MPHGHLLERAAQIAYHDRRAADTLGELVKLQWEHARALARVRVSMGTGAPSEAHEKIDELEKEMIELERTLDERPWTEV